MLEKIGRNLPARHIRRVCPAVQTISAFQWRRGRAKIGSQRARKANSAESNTKARPNGKTATFPHSREAHTLSKPSYFVDYFFLAMIFDYKFSSADSNANNNGENISLQQWDNGSERHQQQHNSRNFRSNKLFAWRPKNGGKIHIFIKSEHCEWNSF